MWANMRAEADLCVGLTQQVFELKVILQVVK